MQFVGLRPSNILKISLHFVREFCQWVGKM